MDAIESLFESNLRDLQLVARGKVRDIYEVDSKRLLIVALIVSQPSMSFYRTPIPGKGSC